MKSEKKVKKMSTETNNTDLQQYQIAIKIAEAHIKLLSQRPIEETMASLTEFEQLKFKTTMAYALTTLQMCYLKAKGENIDSHPNKHYLEKLQALYSKIDKYIDSPSK